MEALESVFCVKLKDVRIGGVVGTAAGKVATIIYPQPSDGDFTVSLVPRVPKLTTRKMKNRSYRKKKSERRGANSRAKAEKSG